MKKVYLFLIAILVFILSVNAGEDLRFFNALKSCTPYSSNGVINTAEIKAGYNSKILGWDGDKCVYKREVKFSGIDACVICKFSQTHLDRLVGVMKAYGDIEELVGNNLDLSDTEALKTNPVVKVWTEYLQDSSVCSISVDTESGAIGY